MSASRVRQAHQLVGAVLKFAVKANDYDAYIKMLQADQAAAKAAA